MYHSVAFRTFTMLCNHRLYLVTKHFTPRKLGIRYTVVFAILKELDFIGKLMNRFIILLTPLLVKEKPLCKHSAPREWEVE